MLLNDVPSGRRLTNKVDHLLSFALTKRRFQEFHFAFSSVINQSTQNHLLWPDFKILYAELDKGYWPFSFCVLSLYCSLWDRCCAVKHENTEFVCSHDIMPFPT